MDGQAAESDSRFGAGSTVDHDEELNPVTPGSAVVAFNFDSSTKDINAQGQFSNDGTASRLRATDSTVAADPQQTRVQFTPANNYFKNVSENKDVAKLVALLATCINATKKVKKFLFYLIIEIHLSLFVVYRRI